MNIEKEKQALSTSLRFYRCRDTSKSLLRDKYHIKIEPYKQLILDTAKKEGLELMEATIKLCTEDDEIKNCSFEKLFVLTALVEIIEPSI